MIARLTWAFHRAGYVVRPYDMLADQRRWFWQPRQQCGWPGFCDGGTPSGFFPTACGRDSVHPAHRLGRPPTDSGSSPSGGVMTTRREVQAVAREIARRTPETVFALESARRRGGEVICEMRGPAVKQQEMRAKLAEMVRRGELKEAFNARIEDGQYVVEYIRLRDPAPHGLRIGSIVIGILGGLAGLGWLVWESRYVIAAALAIALGALCAYVIIMSALHVAGRCPGHHCPGCMG